MCLCVKTQKTCFQTLLSSAELFCHIHAPESSFRNRLKSRCRLLKVSP